VNVTPLGSPQSADRRSFVRAVGVLTGVIAFGSPLAALFPSRVWAVDLAVLSAAEAAALLALIRTIAPHDTLDDAAYALVVKRSTETPRVRTRRAPILKRGSRAWVTDSPLCPRRPGRCA
jgi:hypothetical protein